MRLPAVALAAVFACGAVLGQTQWFAERASSHVYLVAGLALVGFLICSGIFLIKIGQLLPAIAVAGLSWLILGVLGSGVANQPRRNPHGHPNQELLERLTAAGVRILRTDRDGAVHVFNRRQGTRN